VKSEHLQKVAGVFAGDDANGQTALFTDLYKFSHLPILKRIAARLRQKYSQRVYFEKTLSFYERGRMLFLKPRRRIEWNVRQALLDADDLIADLLSGHD
jgi:hypothetical protein